ncbi:MAG: winged helix-turn-helix transcriptional regulator [Deltaproteobacteria bacterium]|nr:winged helix-turn-helix transcriptional regulator [Deltaproteobacteria bacterium]
MADVRRLHEPFVLMNRVQRQFEAKLYAKLHALKGFDALRPAYLAVFRNMNPHGSRITDIAKRAGVTKQAIGLLVKDMAAAGLVEVAPDPDDARARIVRIPKANWKRHEQVAAIVVEMLTELENRIGARGMETLTELLRKLCD